MPTLVKLELTTADPRVVAVRTDTLFTSYPFPVATFTSPAKFACPDALPIFNVVAAPPKFKVVEFVLNKFAVVFDVATVPLATFIPFKKAGFVKKVANTSARS